MQALWLYIKHNQLQDGHEREYINCNRYFRQVSHHTGPLVTQPTLPTAQSLAGLFLGLILHTDPETVLFLRALKAISKPLMFSPDLQLWPSPFL